MSYRNTQDYAKTHGGNRFRSQGRSFDKRESLCRFGSFTAIEEDQMLGSVTANLNVSFELYCIFECILANEQGVYSYCERTSLRTLCRLFSHSRASSLINRFS